MITDLRILCDKCKKPVNHIMTSWNANNDEYIFVVMCHGESERCKVPASIFDGTWLITEAVAFRQIKPKTVTPEPSNDNNPPPAKPLCLEYKQKEKSKKVGPEYWAPLFHTAI